MTPDQKRHIATAMVNRSRQWKTRVGIAGVIALAFFNLVGPVFAGCWFTAYALLQLLERRFAPDGPVARQLGEGYYAACLALVFVANILFGSMAFAEILSGTPEALTCAGLLVGGAIINSVLISPASRRLMVASVAPQLVVAVALPVGALVIHQSPLFAFQLVVAVGLMVMACVSAGARLAKTFAAMEAAKAQAEGANRAKSDFLATMSHEIRTPLNGVLGMAQAMAADELSPRQRERLTVVTQSGQALLTILSDVLDLAKIEARKMELEQADFDLETLVERAAQTFRAIADAKGLSFETRIDPAAIGTWRGDSTRLCQILANLISNAVKFTDEGQVRVSASCSEGGLRFVVEDTGPGVTPAQLPTLFKKFVQADASTTRRYGGTGLGLSICGELATLMGGSITAETVEPHGLRFTFEAPVERIDNVPHPQQQGACGADLGTQDRPLRVLAAEDHPVNRQVLTLLLSQVGITPFIVENGAEAVEAWRAGAEDGPWDLILMDVQMPVMDGPDAARAIRREEKACDLPPVPIIALTANVMTHQIEDYREAGMATFVAKPIQVQALLDGIEIALADAGPAKGVTSAPLIPAQAGN